jgi:predicted GNAT family acetyltransferase
MSGNKALIGSVKTDEKYRNKGFGTLLVTRLCSYLQQNGFEVYLCREENKNTDFYSHIGFSDCGEWTSIK